MSGSAPRAAPAWSWTTTWRPWSASRGAFPGSTALEQARAAGRFTPVHDAWLAAARAPHGDREGTKALIEGLLPAEHMNHEQVVAGPASALRHSALTADAVILEARKITDGDARGQGGLLLRRLRPRRPGPDVSDMYP